jgi:hypothetical protein
MYNIYSGFHDQKENIPYIHGSDFTSIHVQKALKLSQVVLL